MDKFEILIPCYNERLTIVQVVENFRRVLVDANSMFNDKSKNNLLIGDKQELGEFAS